MPTWPGEVASDQKFGRGTNDLLQKVVNFSLRLPAFDLLFLVKKRPFLLKRFKFLCSSNFLIVLKFSYIKAFKKFDETSLWLLLPGSNRRPIG